jgi:DNA repair exonuclease SbcCD ATPase subunit
VAFQLKRLETMAAPLYEREKRLMADQAQIGARAEAMKEQLDETVQDAADLREEMETMMTVVCELRIYARQTRLLSLRSQTYNPFVVTARAHPSPPHTSSRS